MKRQNLRTVSLIVVTFTYLLIGAAIFGYLESEHEMRQREQVDWMEKRVRWKYNISEEDYTVLTTAIIKSVPHKAGIQWQFPGAFYFATTVVTTIGYGHSTPSTLAGRSFCMVYALIGIPLGLVMFQSIGERLNTIVRVALLRVKRCLRTRNPEVTQTNLVMVVLVLSTILMTSMAAIFAKYERWEYFDALYYCFITLTTIGFGDYVALQKESALQSKPEYVILSLVFILFGLSVVSSAVNLLVLKFLTLNTEDERRDEQIRSTAALDPYELKGVEITMNSSKQQLAAARAKLKAKPTNVGQLPSGSSSDSELDELPTDEHEDETGRLLLDKRAGLRPFSQTHPDKCEQQSELDEPDLKYCDPDGFLESPSDRMQLHQRAHNWCAFCHELDEPPLPMQRVDLLAGRERCSMRHELAVYQVANSSSHQLGVCHLLQPAASCRQRPSGSRSQHSFSAQCDEHKPSRANQRARPVTSADEDDSTRSSIKLAPLSADFGGSASRMASSGQWWHNQLAPAERAHIMNSACDHCDGHSNYLRQRFRPQAGATTMDANPYRQHQHYYNRAQRNQTYSGPRCSLSSVRIRPLSDSNDDSNQSIARGALKGVQSRRIPSLTQRQQHAIANQQHRRQSNSCSCSNDSLDQRRPNSPTRSHSRAMQQRPTFGDSPPICSSQNLLLNASRLQEQQLVHDSQKEIRLTRNRSVADIKRDKLRSSTISLGANEPGDRGERPDFLRNLSANEPERATPDALAREAPVPKLLCKCCCEHDECVSYALKHAANSQTSRVNKSPIRSTDNEENSCSKQEQPVNKTTSEGDPTMEADSR